MKFNIKKIILWFKDNERREIIFRKNKVNVITGDSNTGKTTILEIIDYCFFSSKPKIPESVINENVEWYGIDFEINDANYIIARKSLENSKVSDEYYFSSDNRIPIIMDSNSSKSIIKRILEKEFSIDSSVKIPFGGGLIKAGSRVSLRYFLLFNTISGNIIDTDLDIFFDKQNDSRYKEALPRIFDLALGIETVKNVLKKEKKEELQRKLNKLEQKEKAFMSKSELFKQEINSLIKEAKEYGLIEANLNIDNSLENLSRITESINIHSDDFSHECIELEKEISLKRRKIRNLKSFVNEYQNFKKSLANVEDSLKPVVYLKDKDSDLVKTSIFNELLEYFSEELKRIKKSRRKNSPINNQVLDEINQLENEIVKLENRISILPRKTKEFENDRVKYIFLGAMSEKIELYLNHGNKLRTNIKDEINIIIESIKNIKVNDTKDEKEITIKMIEEIISIYMKEIGSVLENYYDYKPYFDYTKKALKLRKPKSSVIESSVGSSSNHMFLHLLFSLAIQETAFQRKSPFVAPFLAIDQPSRPYYGDESKKEGNLEHRDEAKIEMAFKLLNNFVKTRVENKDEFQMIVFEHIPKNLLSDLEYVHIVEVFRDGNALIPTYIASSS